MLQAKVIRFLKRRIFPQQTPFWEYAGRISLTGEFLKKHMTNDDRVLDVGGAPGNNLLRSSGVSNVTVLDLNPKADIVASADKIPLKDNEFSFVTCLDTFEHIPQNLRENVLAELVRVAKKAVIVIAPQDTPENRKAEELVLKYVNEPFLHEHKQHGLLDAQKLEKQLIAMKQAHKIEDFKKQEIDNLLTWTCLMTEDYVNSSKIYQEAHFLENGYHARRVVFTILKNQLSS